jgi:hypothetical protein
MRLRHRRVIWYWHGVRTCETAISAIPRQRDRMPARGKGVASTTMHTPSAARADRCALIRGFMAIIIARLGED